MAVYEQNDHEQRGENIRDLNEDDFEKMAGEIEKNKLPDHLKHK